MDHIFQIKDKLRFIELLKIFAIVVYINYDRIADNEDYISLG